MVVKWKTDALTWDPAARSNYDNGTGVGKRTDKVVFEPYVPRGTKRFSTVVSKYTLWSHSNVDDPHVNITFNGWVPGRWGEVLYFAKPKRR